jgi:hypothetical protein
VKLKSSIVLQDALDMITDGRHRFVCAAIQDVETSVRLDTGVEVKSGAMKLFLKFKPAHIKDDVRTIQEWWPKGSELRVQALQDAITLAKKQGD